MTAWDSVTIPLLVEGNRPLIDVTFRRPDGSTLTARFWVDTGGGGFLIAERLARDLELKWGKVTQERGFAYGQVTEQPDPSIGEVPLELDPERVLIALGRDNLLPPAAPGHADGLLPGHVLAQYHVIFDYPDSRFTLARACTLRPVGVPLRMPVSSSHGFPRTEIEVDGTKHGFLLDTGASFTMESEVLVKSWAAAHPDWPRHSGAFGEAVMLGGQVLETMFVKNARWGPYALDEFGVVSQQEGTYEHWMSSMMAEPVIGALGGNVLTRFRVELDYANETLYVSAS